MIVKVETLKKRSPKGVKRGQIMYSRSQYLRMFETFQPPYPVWGEIAIVCLHIGQY